MEYWDYLETFLTYLPFLLYSFSFLTLIPKSVKKIKKHAKVNFEENCYHRCYGPEMCCHMSEQEWSQVVLRKTNAKPRKPVRRIYAKNTAAAENQKPHHDSFDDEEPIEHFKRQVQPSAIQTRTNVNQIARMFESVVSVKTTVAPVSPRKINRVIPTHVVVPEIRMQTEEAEQRLQAAWNNVIRKQAKSSTVVSKKTQMRKLPDLQLEDRENIENSVNLLNQMDLALLDSEDDYLTHLHSDEVLRHNAKELAEQLSSDLNAVLNDSSTSSTVSPAASSASPDSTPPLSPPANRSTPSPAFNLRSSIEDIIAALAQSAEQTESFIYAGCKTLSPVTSIEDILAQRRLSRPLSAYSISDLLNEEPTPALEETYVDNLLRVIKKT